MKQMALKVQKRPAITKNQLKALRQSGVIPAVVYHRGEESESIQMNSKEFARTLQTEAGRNVLIDLEIEGGARKAKRTVVVKDMQHHPVTGQITHVDLHEISLSEKIKVSVPIVEKGVAEGVKSEGGIMEFPLRAIDVECLPTEIPTEVTVDISKLTLNQSLHVRDLVLPASVKVLTDADSVVIHIAPPHEEKPAAEGEAEVTEPEVIGAKKEEGEEGAEAGKAAPEAKDAKEKKE